MGRDDCRQAPISSPVHFFKDKTIQHEIWYCKEIIKIESKLILHEIW